MIGYYNYSVILTYFGLVSSVFGMAALYSDMKYNIFAAVFCLMLSGVCDLFDGAVASRCKRNAAEKMFGVQIDSLCDLVCFGVFPALIVLKLSGNTRFTRIAVILLVLASVIRLGYFNVQEAMRDKSTRREVYLGLPVTLTALVVPFVLLINLFLKWSNAVFLPIVLILLSAAEISRIPVKKPYGIEKIILAAIGVATFVCLILFGKMIV